MSAEDRQHLPIPGTPIFDGAEAMKGLALNRMCFSLNEAANRQAFLADEDGYCARYQLNAAQRDAVRSRSLLSMIAAGGNIYYLAKLAGAFGMNMQDIGAQQTGVSLREFKAKLLRAGH
jgi:protocatechuate 4,5-dioxygenase alpha chain